MFSGELLEQVKLARYGSTDYDLRADVPGTRIKRQQVCLLPLAKATSIMCPQNKSFGVDTAACCGKT